jgi:hypothetical protein
MPFYILQAMRCLTFDDMLMTWTILSISSHSRTASPPKGVGHGDGDHNRSEDRGRQPLDGTRRPFHFRK